MARCIVIENNFPKSLCTYAVRTAAVIRNRCFNTRLKQTPYYMITGRKSDLSKMNIFGSTCFAFKNLKKNLDPKCEKRIFVRYDRNSPAYLVFYPVAVTDLFPLANQCTLQAIRPLTVQSGAERIDLFFLSTTIFSILFWKSREVREHLVSSYYRTFHV